MRHRAIWPFPDEPRDKNWANQKGIEYEPIIRTEVSLSLSALQVPALSFRFTGHKAGFLHESVLCRQRGDKTGIRFSDKKQQAKGEAGLTKS